MLSSRNCHTFSNTLCVSTDFYARSEYQLTRGIHVMHVFYRIDRARWNSLVESESKLTLAGLQKLIAANSAPFESAPRALRQRRWQS
jgi:hypothetical protein